MATRKTSAARKKTVNKQKQKPFTPKPVKAKFLAGTWLTVLIFIALIAVAVYLNRQKTTANAEATPASAPGNLFSASMDGNPTSIEIKPETGETVRVALDEKKVWALEMPVKTEANQSLAEAAATQISALKILDAVNADPEIFGLNKPAYVVTLKFSNGKTHTLEVGAPTPTTSGYYVRLDKDKMMIVDVNGIDALIQLVAFPPYLNTPTPLPLPPTETPVSPIPAVSTPEATVTPTP
jgi:hypothetical protein